MPKKLSEEDIFNIVSKSDYRLLDIVDEHGRIVVDDNMGYRYETLVSSIKRGCKPFLVYKNNRWSMYNIVMWLKNNDCKLELVDNQVYDGYSHHKKLVFTCLVCKNTVSVSWHDLLGGVRCAYCSGRKTIKEKSIVNFPVYAEWNFDKNGGIVPVDISYGSGKRVWWTCSVCNNEWQARVVLRTTRGDGCPSCFFSKGERAISIYLDSIKIEYFSQYKFDDCKKQRRLSFDFYIPSYNCCIEFNGRQHYEPISFGSSKGAVSINKIFDYQLERDNIKRNYCNQNGIDFLEIPYWDFDNIELILENYLS